MKKIIDDFFKNQYFIVSYKPIAGESKRWWCKGWDNVEEVIKREKLCSSKFARLKIEGEE